MLELKRVSKIYRMGRLELRALDEVSLRVEQGEFLTVMGPSGSGKSTLLHVLGILDRPTSGEYVYRGRDVRGISDRDMAGIRNREIGFVFQGFNLLHDETAARNVALPLLYARARGIREKAMKALDAVGLADRAEHRPFELSGGEQQRVAIARALVKEPALVLADEPTGNLDSASGKAVMDILDGLHRRGITLVVITHDPAVASRGTRILRMRDGRVLESDDPAADSNATPS